MNHCEKRLYYRRRRHGYTCTYNIIYVFFFFFLSLLFTPSTVNPFKLCVSCQIFSSRRATLVRFRIYNRNVHFYVAVQCAAVERSKVFFYTYKRTQIIVPDTVLYTTDPTYTPVYRSAHFIFFINIQGADKIIRLRLPSLPLALLNVLTSITLFVSSRYLENKSQICPQEGARSSFFFLYFNL